MDLYTDGANVNLTIERFVTHSVNETAICRDRFKCATI